MSKNKLSFVLLMLCFSGCALDDIKQYGDQCPPEGESGTLDYILDPNCNAESCSFDDFTQNFESKRCPLQYSKCAKDENGLNYCTTIACGKDEYIDKGKCQPNNLQNCGKPKNDCTQLIRGWAEGTCEEGSCVVSACKDGYKFQDGSCFTLTNCPPTQHYYNGSCEDNDINNCGGHGIKCSQMSGWKSGACENINSHKECTNDSDCDGGICIENECHATECIASECENIYELENGRCISRTTCPPNQHQYKNFCEDDDTDNCGDHNNQCRIAVEGWETGKCEAGRCVVERCKPGYHLSEGRCKDDTPLACGEPPTACAPGQLCSNGTCKDNCDSGYIRCVSLEDIVSCADPLTNSTYCGADSSCTSYISCQTGQTCKEGSCIQTSCPEDGKTLCEIEGQPQCIAIHADDAANCGDCNYNCNEHTPENAVSLGCFEGQCRYECASGYTNCGTSDMMRCLSISSFAADSHNCGGCDIKCDPNDEYCKDNHCLKSTCYNSCLNDGECINTDTKCGTGCLNCNTANDAASGICDNGTWKTSTSITAHAWQIQRPHALQSTTMQPSTA